MRDQVTLDLCGKQFASESLRVAREQGVYTASGKLSMSNEVVAYKGGGAIQALAEVRHAIATCPSGWTTSRLQAVSREQSAITVLHPSGLLPGSVAFVQRLTAQGRGSSKIVHETTVIVFQQRKDVLSAIYTPTLASKALALREAARAKQNLLTL